MGGISEFSAALLGGGIIALACCFHMLTLGRITGLSGTVNSILKMKLVGGFIHKFPLFCGMPLAAMYVTHIHGGGKSAGFEFLGI